VLLLRRLLGHPARRLGEERRVLPELDARVLRHVHQVGPASAATQRTSRSGMAWCMDKARLQQACPAPELVQRICALSCMVSLLMQSYVGSTTPVAVLDSDRSDSSSKMGMSRCTSSAWVPERS
jgi:hypothetical protein